MKIKNLVWPSQKYFGARLFKGKREIITYDTAEKYVKDEELNEHIRKKFECNFCCIKCKENMDQDLKPVTVSMVNMDWFYRDRKTFSDFAKYMMDKPDALYNTEFVKIMIEHFWKDILWILIVYRAIP